MKKLLVVVYRFPPMGGVGTRRWVKFCKYLVRKGWEVHVLTSDYPWVDKVNWLPDLAELEHIFVTRLPSDYPPALLRPAAERTAWQKRIHTLRKVVQGLKMRLNRSIDYASGWTKNLVPFAAEYAAKHGIRTAVFSGPPSSLHLGAAFLKSQVPHLRLIQDYRDPWNNVFDYYVGRIGVPRKADMMTWEKIGLDCADHIVVVSEQMKSELVALYSLNKRKVSVIPNGFDREDFPQGYPDPRKTAHTLTFVYGGTLDSGANSRLEGLTKIIKAAQDLGEPYSSRIRFEIFSEQTSSAYKDATALGLPANVFFNPMVPLRELVDRIGKADVCLSINRKEDNYAIGSKIYDYMAMGKPIFHLASGGELSDMLRKEGQYVAEYSEGSIREQLLRLFERADSGIPSALRSAYDGYDISKSVDRYELLLNE